MPTIVGSGESDPGSDPTDGHPGAVTGDPGDPISSEPQSSPNDPGNDAGGGIASIIGGHGTAASAGSIPDPKAPAPPPAFSGSALGATDGGSPDDPGVPSAQGVPQANGQGSGTVSSNGGSPIVGGQPVAADPAAPGGIVVGGNSIAQGEATTIAGTAISNGPHGVVIGSSSTVSLPSLGQSSTTIGGQPVVIDPNTSGGIIIGSNSIAQGQATTVGGTVISNGPKGIVVGSSSTVSLSTPAQSAPANADGVSATPAAIFTMLGQTYTAQAGQPLTMDGKTLSAGGSAVDVNGQTVSVGPSGVVVGESSMAYSTASGFRLGAPTTEFTAQFSPVSNAAGFSTSERQAAFTGTSGTVFTAVEPINGASTAVLDNSVTLSVGGPNTVLGGRTVSLAPGGLVVDGHTDAFSSTTYAPSASGQTAVYTDGQGHKHTAVEATGESTTAVIDGSVTLTVGDPATILNGMTLTLASNGLVVDGPLPTGPSASAAVEEVTFTDSSGQTHSAFEAVGESGVAVVDGSVTLTVGGQGTTLDGETLSLASTGLVVDGTTQAFTTATASNGGGGAASTLGVDTSPSGPSSVQTANSSGAERSQLSCVYDIILAVSAVLMLIVYV